MRIGLLALAATVLLVFPGCGGGNGNIGPGHLCGGNIIGAIIQPDNFGLDHTAPPPNNQWTLSVSGRYDTSSGCVDWPGPPLKNVTWSVSDPASVSLAAKPDSNEVTATCLAATSGPVTITATAAVNHNTLTATARLTCN